jgi:DivIVA domain-containing protein
MTWFFAVLLVLAMGGVAVVASGRGGSLPRVYDDRPDVRLPDGPLAGEDLRRVRFPLAVRGYRMTEVDELLARLADQLDGRLDVPPGDHPDGSPDGTDDGARGQGEPD